MVIVTTGDHPAMHFQNKFPIDGPMRRLRCYPLVGRFGRPQLPLRIGQIRAVSGGRGQSFTLFLRCELCPFDT